MLKKYITKSRISSFLAVVAVFAVAYSHAFAQTAMMQSTTSVNTSNVRAMVDPDPMACPRIDSLKPSTASIGSTVLIKGCGFFATGNVISIEDQSGGITQYKNVPSTDGKTLTFIVPSTLDTSGEAGASSAPLVVGNSYNVSVATTDKKTGISSLTIGDAPAWTIKPASFGDSNSNVMAIQKVLSANGLLDSSSITGFFGKKTEDAVKKFQIMKGLTAAGNVGTQTINAISALPLPTATTQTVLPTVTPTNLNTTIVNAVPLPVQNTTTTVTPTPVPTPTPIPTPMPAPAPAVSSLGCDLDLIGNTNTCNGVVSVSAQTGGQALVAINLDPKLVGAGAKARFDVAYGSNAPEGWNVDIGDSPENDGYGGGYMGQSNTAELNIITHQSNSSYGFYVFGNDNILSHPESTLDGHLMMKKTEQPNMSFSGKVISFTVGDKELKYDLSSINPSDVGDLQSPYLYALAGEPDMDAGVSDYKVYGSFNRVITGRPDRIGTGVVKVHISILPTTSIATPSPTQTLNVSPSPVSVTAPALTKNLGDFNSGILSLQNLLVTGGFLDKSLANGYLNPETISALKALQASFKDKIANNASASTNSASQ